MVALNYIEPAMTNVKFDNSVISNNTVTIREQHLRDHFVARIGDSEDRDTRGAEETTRERKRREERGRR